MAASAKSRRACGPSFVFLARPRSCDALKSPRNATGIAMTNLHRSPPMNQSETDLGIVNESQLLRFGMTVYARQLALEPHLQILRRYRRSLLLRLEYARRPTLENHVHRITPVGTWVLINETWYYSKPIEYPPPLGHVLERFR